MVDLRTDDPRVAEVEALPLPAVVLGGPDGAGSLPCLWNDDASTMAEVVHYLAALGHRCAVHVAGPQGFMHTGARTRSEERRVGKEGRGGGSPRDEERRGQQREEGVKTT